ncbi:hypothetical protein J437_LFUL001967 [Ladona fulva]|uniref:Uncharacterized protein n=1 Tax=Ladona fulva TaxID=123851 RepID=A0A8K0NVN3_LADFU|nr:hypothetical protein J437_LFUL001967 [Ladona fulva]
MATYVNYSDTAEGDLGAFEFFTCADNRSLPVKLKCDFKWDCIDGEDETDCRDPPPCPTGSRDKKVAWFRCNNGQCILEKQRCDLKYQCWDKSDEMGCGEFIITVLFNEISKTRQKPILYPSVSIVLKVI